MIVTVFGGTGYVGGRIAAHLREGGATVRIATRHPERSRDANAVGADVLDPSSLWPALQDAHAAVNAISLYQETERLSFEDIHVRGAANLARAAREGGLSALVHVSGMGADARAEDGYIRARGRGEIAVRQEFPRVTILRPSAVFGEGGGIVEKLAGFLRVSPVFPLFGDGMSRLQPVDVNDIARAAVSALGRENARGATYELGGADVLTYRDLVAAIGAALGRRTVLLPVPYGVWEGLAPLAERVPNAPLSRAQVALIRGGAVARPGAPGFADLGIHPRGICDAVAELSGARRGALA